MTAEKTTPPAAETAATAAETAENRTPTPETLAAAMMTLATAAVEWCGRHDRERARADKLEAEVERLRGDVQALRDGINRYQHQAIHGRYGRPNGSATSALMWRRLKMDSWIKKITGGRPAETPAERADRRMTSALRKVAP